MLLYHTTNERGAEKILQPSGGAGPRRRRSQSVTFTSQPLAGHGAWVYALDMPDRDVARYEMEAPLQIQGVRYFDLPTPQIPAAALREVTFREVTDRLWSEWEILLKAASPDRANTWSRVWASRTGVATARMLERRLDLTATLRLTPLYDPAQDYLILETQQFGGRQWSLELLCGTAPAWADFPTQYNEWVMDDEVQKSVVSFLLEHFPTLSRDIQYASDQETKVNRIRAWRIVAESLGNHLGRSLGKIPAGSWTSTHAMPIRIAQRVGGWEPPHPKPEYANPDESGRVLVVGPDEVVNPNRVERRFTPEVTEGRESSAPFAARRTAGLVS